MIDSRVGILNLDMGNLRSVSNAVYSLGFDPHFVSLPAEVDDLTHLIMPGVGSFHTAMRRMRSHGLADAVRGFAHSGRPLLGLCLGMQLLATTGVEGEVTEGLDLIPGQVTKFDEQSVAAIPHVGWNAVEFIAKHPVLDGVRTGVDFYFVHSFYVSVDNADTVLGTTNCGQRFPSAVGRGNVIGFQFHPEKSQINGLRLLQNFCGWNGRC